MNKLFLIITLFTTTMAVSQSAPISDSTALELVFMTTCSTPTHLAKYKFADEAGVSKMLTAHCTQYQALIDKHNKQIQKEFEDAVKAKRDYNPPLDQEFPLSLRALVGNTTDQLKQRYPADYDHFLATVQDEKQNMTRYEDTAMMPGQTGKMNHVHPAPKVNALQAIDQYSDYGYTVYDTFGTNGYTGWYSLAIVGASQNNYFCVWDSYHGQWQPPPCPNIYHTPTIYMTVSGGAPTPDYESFSISGTPLLPNQYMSWSFSNRPTGWNFYGPSKPRLTINGGLQLACTIAGTLISWPRAPTFTEAYTRGYVYPNAIPFPSPCPGMSWCSAATTPPFSEFRQLRPLTPSACSHTYWDGYQIYVSYTHSGWRSVGSLGSFALATTDGSKGQCDTAATMPIP